MTDRRTFLAGLLGGTAMGAVPATAVPLYSGGSAAGAPALLLLECHIAGTGYAEIPDSLLARLAPGLSLICRREPENAVDPLAIRIELAGRKLGYVPRAKNEVLARLMDGGARVEARITNVETVRSWLKVDVGLWLHGSG